MKYRFIILLMLGLMTFNPMLQAQKPGEVKLKKADRYFFLNKFDKAIEQYKRVLEKQPGNYMAERRIADSYRLRNNSVDAEKWYALTAKDAKADSLDFLYYAQALRNNGKYDEAKTYFGKYAELAPNDTRGKSLAASMDNLPAMKADSLKYTVALVDSVNSEFSDFSPAFYNDSNLVFPSARSKKKIDVWSEQPFLDLYVAEKGPAGFKTPTQVTGKINKKYHQGPVTFSSDYKEMYFTRNNYSNIKMKKGEDDIMKMIIVKSTLQLTGEWKDLDVLSFNSRDYSVQHPTLSPDGKTLYFSSNMPGGFGAFDLYQCSQEADGQWGKPVNLGDGINTRGDEGFPFIGSSKGDTLFFASDSYIGFGGLDIYIATLKDGKWSNVTNMGYPINGAFDDFGLIMNKQGTGGYFSSNRPGGPGSDDIYSWRKGGPCVTLKAVVYDRQTNDPIDQATVKVVNGTDTIAVLTSNAQGEVKYCVPRNITLVLLASKPGYLPNRMNINTTGIDENSPPVRIPLDKEGLRLVGTAFEVKVSDLTKIENRVGTLGNVEVKLQDLTDNTIDSIKSDGSGGFSFLLKPDHQYKLTGDKELYFLKSEVTFDTKGKTSGVVSQDIELYKFEGTIRLVNIYYDFDKYNIRPDAAKELDRLYGYLLKYPDMVIQMRSHTDCRAGKTYNMILSANRAQSAANYLIKRGNKDKKDMLKNITASGFGESLPVYPGLCATEQGVPDSKETKEVAAKHQTNRRTEFYVVKQPQAIHVESSPIIKK